MAAIVLQFPVSSQPRSANGTKRIACELAQYLCKKIGVRVLWRPGGLDTAEVEE